jgi:hypothetical protein
MSFDQIFYEPPPRPVMRSVSAALLLDFEQTEPVHEPDREPAPTEREPEPVETEQHEDEDDENDDDDLGALDWPEPEPDEELPEPAFETEDEDEDEPEPDADLATAEIEHEPQPALLADEPTEPEQPADTSSDDQLVEPLPVEAPPPEPLDVQLARLRKTRAQHVKDRERSRDNVAEFHAYHERARRDAALGAPDTGEIRKWRDLKRDARVAVRTYTDYIEFVDSEIQKIESQLAAELARVDTICARRNCDEAIAALARSLTTIDDCAPRLAAAYRRLPDELRDLWNSTGDHQDVDKAHRRHLLEPVYTSLIGHCLVGFLWQFGQADIPVRIATNQNVDLDPGGAVPLCERLLYPLWNSIKSEETESDALQR